MKHSVISKNLLAGKTLTCITEEREQAQDLGKRNFQEEEDNIFSCLTYQMLKRREIIKSLSK